MKDPAYVAIAADYAHQIRSGSLPAGTQLRSLNEMVERHKVSKIVIIEAIRLLERQGLVRTVPSRGTFVTDHPNLVRIAPERQMEDPEDTFRHESGGDIRIERESERMRATQELADAFAIDQGSELMHVITRALENGRPISISDTYRPVGVPDISAALFLEESVADRLPSSSHGEWLRTPTGGLVKAVRQRYLGTDDQVLMISDISYPHDRYDAFVSRMALTNPPKQSRAE
ncbi:GntR family transcriptional regulator [Nocardia sp. NBC_01503]|uniref:GntR family transcriptional regulator n=1 Tax=Nocardia sp. NBC_01503 TaxID=2975997 RepID=UPI002E7B9EC8|nr:GntR family transcriptional regulator [Nocardia sp. NBC_01503]WTL32375.1 GntR family transcriptional regulator [Nocardia sp. NBC_01503]